MSRAQEDHTRGCILIVDDEALIVMGMARLLKEAGYAVLEASSGGEALRVAQAAPQRPDLVLLDVGLPDMNGLEVCRQLKAQATPPGIFVVLFSGLQVDSEAQAAGLETGADGYIARPVSERELLARVQTFMRLKQTENALWESEQRYLRITGALTDYIYTVAFAAGQVVATRHGPGCVSVTGYTAEEFAADPYLWFRMVAPADRAQLEAHAQQVLAQRNPPALEHRLTRKDGAERWVRNTPVPHYDAQGQLVSYDGLIQDITDRKQAEMALGESRANLQSLIESTDDLIASRDRAGRLIAFNPAFAQLVHRLFGVEARPGLLTMDYLPAAARAPWEAALQHALAGETYCEEFTWTFADGEQRHYELRLHPIRAGEAIIGSTEFTRDITQRRQSEAALRASEAQYRRLVENSHDLICEVDAQARYQFVSPQYLPILGYAPAELLGRPAAELIHPEDAKASGPRFSELMATRQTAHNEWRFRHKNGQWRWFECRAQAYEKAPGEVCVVVMSRDITERKQVEEALRASEERYRTLIETVNTGIFMSTLEGRFLQVNPTVAALAGYATPEEFMQVPAQNLYVDPDARRPLIEALQRTGAVKDVELRSRRKDGARYWISLSAVLVQGPAGQPATMLGSVVDITARKEAEDHIRQLNTELEQHVAERTAELQQANAELLRAGRLKDEFLANMSHELRTPLTAILGLAEALEMGNYGPLPDKQAHMMVIIRQSGQHLLALITDILDLSKIEAGKTELQLAPAVVAEICEASLQFIKQPAQKKNIQVAFSLDPKVRLMHLDARRLKQMIVNLLNNAVKFTPEGGRVGLVVEGLAPQREVTFTVWDTGIGIAPEKQPLLFQPFVQVDGGLTRKYEGTGLGLALTRRLAEMHGGRISVESAGHGQGSRFTVTLPWRLAETPTHLPPPPPPPKAAMTLASGQAAVILLADDNLATLTAIGDFLQALSARVITAQTGREALAQVQAAKPHLILMDIQMPDLDGLEAIRRLKAAPETAAIPILALTALAMSGDRERCLAAGADAYLSKPVNLDELVRLINQHLKV